MKLSKGIAAKLMKQYMIEVETWVAENNVDSDPQKIVSIRTLQSYEEIRDQFTKMIRDINGHHSRDAAKAVLWILVDEGEVTNEDK